jgi:ketosteroid isomerase-like protein
MSADDVETVQRAFEALFRREYDEAECWLWADVEWHNTAAFPGPRTIVGARAIGEFRRELFEAFEDEKENTIERTRAGADSVAVIVRAVVGGGRLKLVQVALFRRRVTARTGVRVDSGSPTPLAANASGEGPSFRRRAT